MAPKFVIPKFVKSKPVVVALVAVVAVAVIAAIWFYSTRDSTSTVNESFGIGMYAYPKKGIVLPEAKCNELFSKPSDKTKCVTAIKAFNNLSSGTNKTPETALQAFRESARALVAMDPAAVAAVVVKNSKGEACVAPDVRSQSKALSGALIGALAELPAIIKWSEKVSSLLPICKAEAKAESETETESESEEDQEGGMELLGREWSRKRSGGQKRGCPDGFEFRGRRSRRCYAQCPGRFKDAGVACIKPTRNSKCPRYTLNMGTSCAKQSVKPVW